MVSWGAGSSCPSFLQPFRGLFRRGTPEPHPRAFGSACRPGPAGPGRTGPVQRGGVLRAGPDQRATSWASPVPAPRCGPGRPGTGLNLDPGRPPGFRRQAEAAAGLPDFGWPGSAHTVFTPRGRGLASCVALCACWRACSLFCPSGGVARRPWTYAVERGPLGALQRCAAVMRRAFARFICCEPWADRDCVRVVGFIAGRSRRV